jgi:hypothetical protein
LIYAEGPWVGKSERCSKEIQGGNIDSAAQKRDFAPLRSGLGAPCRCSVYMVV